FGRHRASAVRVLGKFSGRAVGEKSGLLKAAAHDRGGIDVVLAEIVDCIAIQWVEPNGCFECVADLEGEAETGYRSGAVGLHAVCTAGPVLCRAVVGERAKR